MPEWVYKLGEALEKTEKNFLANIEFSVIITDTIRTELPDTTHSTYF